MSFRQVQPRTSEGQYKGVWSSLVRMWKEEGFKGYMRGNGVNCLRIVPYSAVQFTTYEQVKKVSHLLHGVPVLLVLIFVVLHSGWYDSAGYPKATG